RLGGTPGDEHARGGIVAAHLADRMLGLTHSLSRDSAGVDDDSTAGERSQPRRMRPAPHHFRFIGIQPTTEGEDVDTLRIAHGWISSRLPPPRTPPHKGEGDSGTWSMATNAAAEAKCTNSPPPCGEGLGVGVFPTQTSAIIPRPRWRVAMSRSSDRTRRQIPIRPGRS